MATISIDLDNVIRDQIGSIINAAGRRYGVFLSRDAFDRWDPPLGHYVGVPEDEFTRWAWGDPMIFAESKLIPGVWQAMTELASDHRIIITTSTACPELSEPWLRWWKVPYHDLIHTRSKEAIVFDLHIDDSPATLQKLAAAGRPVMRFDLPWNRSQEVTALGLSVLHKWDGHAVELIEQALETETGCRARQWRVIEVPHGA